jgi:hypothetical protein
MFIKDLVMWRHYNVISENNDITTRPWQRLPISNNLNRLSANVIWNTLNIAYKDLNMKPFQVHLRSKF